MSLAISPILQTENRCGQACLRMVLKFYGREVSDNEIERMLSFDAEGLSYEIDLARVAQHFGLQAHAFAYNVYLTDPARDAIRSQREVLASLQQQVRSLTDQWCQSTCVATIQALEAGVRYHIRKPSLELIQSQVRNGAPLICSVNAAALYQRQGDPTIGHDILLTGSTGRSLHVIDPAVGKTVAMAGEDVFFGLSARGFTAITAYLIAITEQGLRPW